jgi:hypothetical protein
MKKGVGEVNQNPNADGDKDIKFHKKTPAGLACRSHCGGGGRKNDIKMPVKSVAK